MENGGAFLVMSVPSGKPTVYYNYSEAHWRNLKKVEIRHLTLNAGPAYNITNEDYLIYYRFVKINENFDAHALLGTCLNGSTPVVVANLGMYEGYGVFPQPVGPAYSGTFQIAVNAPHSTLHFARRTCATPTVDEGFVRLPVIYPHQLPSVGSVGPEKEFTLKINCPTSLGYIGYWVDPVHGVADGLESQGVININPASTAKGIGLQITSPTKPWPYYAQYDYYRDANIQVEYRPIQFGPANRYPWSGYPIYGSGNPLTDSVTYHNVPLRVRVYRTGDIVPGAFNAAVRIHMVYR